MGVMTAGDTRQHVAALTCYVWQHAIDSPLPVDQNPKSEGTQSTVEARQESVDRHEPAPVCDPSVMEASRAIIFEHLHKPPDPELGKQHAS